MPVRSNPNVDPVYASSLRELKWILVIWLVNALWVVGYCVWFGYPDDDRPLTTVIGIPSWVFWGVLVPWVVAASVSSWFALTRIEDHPLDESESAASKNHEDGSETA